MTSLKETFRDEIDDVIDNISAAITEKRKKLKDLKERLQAIRRYL